MQQQPLNNKVKYKTPAIFSQIIFASRWLQLPIYLGLIVVQDLRLQIYEIPLGADFQFTGIRFQRHYAFCAEFD